MLCNLRKHNTTYTIKIQTLSCAGFAVCEDGTAHISPAGDEIDDRVGKLAETCKLDGLVQCLKNRFSLLASLHSGQSLPGGGEQKPRANRAQAAGLSLFGCRGVAIMQC